DFTSASVSSISASVRTSMVSGVLPVGSDGRDLRSLDMPAGRRPAAGSDGPTKNAVSGGECLVDGGLDDVQALLQQLLRDGERGQQLHDLVGGAGGLQQQALLEGARGDRAGDLAGGHLQAAGETAALDHELVVGVAGRDPVEARLDVGAL